MSTEGQAAAIGDETHGPATGTMQAVVQDGYGPAEVLRLARVARPALGDHEVLVRVHAAGLDRGTWHLMTGKPYLLRLVFGHPPAEEAGARAATSPAPSSRSGRR